jgi:hypothetical protein
MDIYTLTLGLAILLNLLFLIAFKNRLPRIFYIQNYGIVEQGWILNLWFSIISGTLFFQSIYIN